MQRMCAPGDEVRPRVIVSVHDVAPSALSQVRWLLDRLDEAGAKPRVLKVIPNEGGRRPIGREGELVELLRREAAAGSETVLHGYTHVAAGLPRVGIADRLRWRLFARSAAEFAALGPALAAERVAAGRDALAELGLSVTGFCAPGWLGGPGLAEVLRTAGFSYLVTFTWLVDLQRGPRAPPFRSSVSSCIRRERPRPGRVPARSWRWSAWCGSGGPPRTPRCWDAECASRS
jgi:predicted deacetylase